MLGPRVHGSIFSCLVSLNDSKKTSCLVHKKTAETHKNYAGFGEPAPHHIWHHLSFPLTKQTNKVSSAYPCSYFTAKTNSGLRSLKTVSANK